MSVRPAYSGCRTPELSDTYYMASAECYQVKYVTGDIATPDGTRVYLGIDDGYYSCQRSKSGAARFDSPEQIKELWLKWDGMPWMFRLKPDSLKIEKVQITRAFSESVEEVKT